MTGKKLVIDEQRAVIDVIELLMDKARLGKSDHSFSEARLKIANHACIIATAIIEVCKDGGNPIEFAQHLQIESRREVNSAVIEKLQEGRHIAGKTLEDRKIEVNDEGDLEKH